MKVFLGGTCNGSNWRAVAKSLLEAKGLEYFDPVVSDWNEEAYQREIYEREHCDYVMYCITPKMTGVYSIAEVVDDSNKRPKKTIFVVLNRDEETSFSEFQMKSLMSVARMIIQNGGLAYTSIIQACNAI
jgi:hypothetical protein